MHLRFREIGNRIFFLQGMLKLSRSNHTAVKDLFSGQNEEDVDRTYGTEGGSGDEADGTDELNRVHVPRIPCPFTQQQWDSIKEKFDPLRNDAADPHGLNLFKDLLDNVPQID